MKLIAIAAMGKNRQIGLNGKLPWSIPDEYKHYQDTVRGHDLIIGRKNFEQNRSDVQIGKPIVLTQNKNFEVHEGEDVKVFHHIKEAIEFLKQQNIEKAFVIGGEQIYRLALDYLDEIILSQVDYTGPADTYFPDFDKSQWTAREIKRGENWVAKSWTRR